jgi:hypothetical protein
MICPSEIDKLPTRQHAHRAMNNGDLAIPPSRASESSTAQLVSRPEEVAGRQLAVQSEGRGEAGNGSCSTRQLTRNRKPWGGRELWAPGQPRCGRGSSGCVVAKAAGDGGREG